MSEPKPFASLGPTLLARKGAARPAMRAQFQPFGIYERQGIVPIEDLGWNDMGHESEDESPRPAEVVALTHAPAGNDTQDTLAGESDSDAGLADDDSAESTPQMPEVLRQQEEIARKVAQPAAQIPAEQDARTSARSAADRRSALDDGRRAAFTLRVDAERHLKLRLACTIRNLSAQQIVTEALDRLLSGIPELDSLAAQLKRK
ncbi:hypothetical protein SZ64_16620 [Erythrobacter sp. SG61-1L]|uniref:hypothetical protein n=1 Tax=Erythrobacter sp. SG61-1L TaxID=1603897 RepID=UPI0006C92079|nr:hypothetical protein [Erythrobacter sp. SG61-1L]KPL69570.1 hypothetical protein SZ64_16620 [Erythrobacter sp. SG61-1L]